MRLLSYIKGDRCTSASREIERRSLSDPFLSDAIDGYENRAGKGAHHIRNIAELERHICKRRFTDRKQWPLLILIAFFLIVLCGAIMMLTAM